MSLNSYAVPIYIPYIYLYTMYCNTIYTIYTIYIHIIYIYIYISYIYIYMYMYYRDDRLLILRGTNGQKTDKTRKNII